MSKVVTALNGASHKGYVTVSEAPLTGMVTLRGDFSAANVKKAVMTATGCSIPDVRKMTSEGDVHVGWMSPDELIVLCAYDAANTVVDAFHAALAGEHGLAVNVSDARAKFQITGDSVREVVAKLAPVDMAEFEIGELRRTRFSQVAAAFWMSDSATVDVICFRSVGQYMFDLLKISTQPGFEVGSF